MGLSLPTADEAERSVLGAILLHPVSYTEVGDLLHESDFGHPAHNGIYDAMVALDRAGKPIDALTIAAEMKAADTLSRLNAVGGEQYLFELPSLVISVESVRFHAKMVMLRARRRRCASSLIELSNLARRDTISDEDYFEEQDRVIAQLLTLPMAGGPKDVRVVMREVIRELGEKYTRRMKGENVDIDGVPTGFDKLDWLLGGLQAKFYILAARPSMGKTAWVLNASANAAAKGFPVLGFSLEMGSKEMVGRMLSSDARVNGHNIMRADLTQRDWVQLTKSASNVAEYPMKLEDISGMTFDSIRSTARRWRMKHPKNEKGEYTQKALVWIDYLQLISGIGGDEDPRKSENRQQEITRVSRGLHDLVKELQCPVVALSQLNRGLENRDDKRPRMSDLRESGSLEQDADVIAFLYRDEVYSKDKCDSEDRGVAEFIVSKHRGGPTGVERLVWLDKYTRFENLARREPSLPPSRYGDDA